VATATFGWLTHGDAGSSRPFHPDYRVTALGRAVATFFTNLASRAMVPVLSELARPTRPPGNAPSKLVAAWQDYDHQLRQLTNELGRAA
jgi:hypothetical protein